MGPFKCCLCLHPAVHLPDDFKAMFTNLTQFFNKLFQSCSKHCIILDELTLCRSCLIYFVQVRQLDHELRLKKSTCDAKKASLSSKIRRAQQSLLAEEENSLSNCGDFEVQSSASEDNEDDVSNANGLSLGMDTTEVIYFSLNKTDESDSESQSSGTAEVITIDNVPDSTSLPEQEPTEATVNDTSDSASKLEPAQEDNRLMDNVSVSPSSPAEEPTEVTSTDTSGTESDWEPAKRRTLRNVSASTISQEKIPADVTSNETSESDSEAEPSKSSQITIADKEKSIPKILTHPKSLLDVKRLSEQDFTFMDKYSFQATATGFKCGLCSYIAPFCKVRWNSIWRYIIRHITAYHIGNHKVRVNRVTKRFVKIGPNRFQYGKYKVELIDGNYRCEECGELRAPCTLGRGNKAGNIMDHINTRHENLSKTYVCEHCGKVYRSSFSYSEHKKTKHGNPDGPVPCSECGKTFPTRFRALLHRRQVHGPKKKFVCEICGKECNVKASLQQHIAFVHDKQKFECTDCDKVFGSKFSLNIHRHCHLGTKFTCDICGMDFSQQCSVKRHKKTAHAQ